MGPEWSLNDVVKCMYMHSMYFICYAVVYLDAFATGNQLHACSSIFFLWHIWAGILLASPLFTLSYPLMHKSVLIFVCMANVTCWATTEPFSELEYGSNTTTIKNTNFFCDLLKIIWSPAILKTKTGFCDPLKTIGSKPTENNSIGLEDQLLKTNKQTEHLIHWDHNLKWHRVISAKILWEITVLLLCLVNGLFTALQKRAIQFLMEWNGLQEQKYRHVITLFGTQIHLPCHNTGIFSRYVDVWVAAREQCTKCKKDTALWKWAQPYIYMMHILISMVFSVQLIWFQRIWNVLLPLNCIWFLSDNFPVTSYCGAFHSEQQRCMLRSGHASKLR